MNLKWTLITRIWLLAFFCLLLASAHVLWQTVRDQEAQLSTALDTISKQVRNRFATVSMGFAPTGFDREGRFLFWDPITGADIRVRVCVRYLDEQAVVRASSCHGPHKQRHDRSQTMWAPGWFAAVHRFLFHPGQEVSQPVSWDGQAHGRVVAALDAEDQIAEAWQNVSRLIGLALLTVLSLCILVYFVISRALRPTRDILAGLEKLERGELGTRLARPRFPEFATMSDGFNRLAASLESSIAARAELTRRMVDVQEEERRYLARELHDEFGQCLAAMTAVSASIVQTAEEEGSGLVADGEKLSRITGHLLQSLRDILKRLRPAGLEELGLVESLRGVAAECSSRGTRIDVQTGSDLEGLPEVVTISVYRVVQECLTNIMKHASATKATVTVARRPNPDACVDIVVTDDGNAGDLSFLNRPGMGLLGMRERVTVLGGTLSIEPGQPRGLVVRARIPVTAHV
ncbi:MAG: sensor histidine kinase [Burkholderiales bacterium]